MEQEKINQIEVYGEEWVIINKNNLK